MKGVYSWGRLALEPHRVIDLHDPAELAAQLEHNRPGIAYGLGRSYGDACLAPGDTLWRTPGLGRLIAFDAQTGVLHCEAGVTLREIQRLFMPRGWMLPVTPGTQWVTVGGAIANDVHGKNHHRFGSFGDHVRALRLLRTDGQQIECGPRQEPGWFAATLGGIGLTGLIVSASLQLRRIDSSWLTVQTLPYASLEEFFALSDASETDWEHTVSWIDCFSRGGRGIFMRANPASAGLAAPAPGREKRVPWTPPLSLVNRWSLPAFNLAYYALQRRHVGRERQVAHEPFSCPLDQVQEWNRLYGPHGFYQYQSVVPRRDAQAALAAMLDAIARSGEGSFLAVLKTFGERRSLGMLGFPQPGVTLALDFPNRGARTHRLFASLDAIVREAGGKLYLAKDARMPRALFEAGYPELNSFQSWRDHGMRSSMSRRLMAD